MDFLRAKLNCCLRFSLPLQKDDGNRIGISASETICMSRNNDEHYSEGVYCCIAYMHIYGDMTLLEEEKVKVKENCLPSWCVPFLVIRLVNILINTPVDGWVGSRVTWCLFLLGSDAASLHYSDNPTTLFHTGCSVKQ